MPSSTLVIVIFIIAFDAIVVPILIAAAIHGCWSPLPKRYPGVDPRPDAVVKQFQSMRVGLLNLGWSVHIAADEEHLHFTPVRIFRAAGAKATSIPWEAVKVTKLHKRSGTATIAGQRVQAPAWCLELAEPQGPQSAPAR